MFRNLCRTLLLITLSFGAPQMAATAFAEQTLVLRMGEGFRCEPLTMSGKPSSGGYDIDRFWVQREGVVAYVYKDKEGLICFEPLRVDSTKIKISGTVYEFKPNGTLEYRKRFYRNFQLRVRPPKADDSGGNPLPQ